tara:strand:+ start:515 stop:1321 length:807 start_codon:yes stop_codon:yes gene_type:complete
MPPFTLHLRRNLVVPGATQRDAAVTESNRSMHWHLAVQHLARDAHCPHWEQARRQIAIDLQRHQQGPVQHRFAGDGARLLRLLRLHAVVDGRNPYVQGNLYIAKAVLEAEQDMASTLRSYVLLVNALSHYGPGADNIRVSEMEEEKYLGRHTFLARSLRMNRDVAEVLINQRLLFLGFSQVTQPCATSTCQAAVLDYLVRYGRRGAIALASAFVRLRSRSLPFHDDAADPDRTQWVCRILIPGSHPGDALLGVQQVASMLALAATGVA